MTGVKPTDDDRSVEVRRSPMTLDDTRLPLKSGDSPEIPFFSVIQYNFTK